MTRSEAEALPIGAAVVHPFGPATWQGLDRWDQGAGLVLFPDSNIPWRSDLTLITQAEEMR